jgi:hypothetical protein
LRVRSSILIFISKKYIVIIFMVFVQYFSEVAKMDSKENNGTRLLPSTSNKGIKLCTWSLGYIYIYIKPMSHPSKNNIN